MKKEKQVSIAHIRCQRFECTGWKKRFARNIAANLHVQGHTISLTHCVASSCDPCNKDLIYASTLKRITDISNLFWTMFKLFPWFVQVSELAYDWWKIELRHNNGRWHDSRHNQQGMQINSIQKTSERNLLYQHAGQLSDNTYLAEKNNRQNFNKLLTSQGERWLTRHQLYISTTPAAVIKSEHIACTIPWIHMDD